MKIKPPVMLIWSKILDKVILIFYAFRTRRPQYFCLVLFLKIGNFKMLIYFSEIKNCII